MLALLYYPFLWAGFYVSYLLYTYIGNVLIARQTNFPTIHYPLLVQNHIAWMIFGPITRPWLKRHFPTFLFNRIALTIYGTEFHQGQQPYEDYVLPQHRANPRLSGKGKSYYVVSSGRLELWTWDAEIAREVTARPNDFQQFDISSTVIRIFGDNAMTLDGADWARHRRIVAGAVTERVSSLVWNESVRQTRALLASISKAGIAPDGRLSDSGTTSQMFDLIKRVTIHVLYAAGMGNQQDFESGDSASGGEKTKSGMELTYIDAVKIINENTAGPTILPTPLLRNWPTFLPWAAWLRKIGQAKVEFPQHTRDALAKEKTISAETGQVRNNVMSALIAASEGDKSGLRKGPALTDEELVGNLYLFTAAGFDTSSNALAYALVLLARNSKWQNWLMEELDAILPSEPNGDFNYQTIFPKAHRALAILLETLRLFPPIIHLAKMTKSPQTLTTENNGTFTIPAHTTVYVNSVGLHQDPAVWRNLNMTDVESKAAKDDEDGVQGDECDFRPSRWINPPGSASPIFQPPKGTYVPWSAGPRVCPGQKMAQVEFVGILATLFSRHRMDVVRKAIPVKGASDIKLPESDDALKKRLDLLMENSTPKLTLEMDVYNIQEGEDRGLGLAWIRRK